MSALRKSFAIVALAAGVQLLDLTTSLIPSPADASWPVRVPGSTEIVIRALLSVPLFALLWINRARLAQTIRAWRVPKVAGGIIAAFLVLQIVHVALRYERFPFSPVAMFSNAVQLRPDRQVELRPGYAVLVNDTPILLSFLREGSLWPQALADLDYKSGWALRIHATAWRRAAQRVSAGLAKNPAVQGAQRFTQPKMAVDLHTGRWRQAAQWKASVTGQNAPQP